MARDESADVLALLAAAAEGCRELDLLVWQAASGKLWRFMEGMGGQQEVITWDRYGPGATGNPVVSLDPFTTSLDAALTLVPEGWTWTAGRHETGCGHAYMHNGELHFAGGNMRPNPARRHSEVRAATPPLALCIAALRSQAGRHG